VKLGLIPGAGGTQRLPRLAGVVKAAEMCATGEPIRAPEALQYGIVDRIIDGDLLPGAVAFARELAAQGGPPPTTPDRTDKQGEPQSDAAGRDEVHEAIQKKARNLLAPFKAIDAVAAARLPFAEGCKREGELFNECLFSDQSKALIHVFFGERAVAKVPGIG